MTAERDRRADGRPRNARPRDTSGRPLPRGGAGSPTEPDPQPAEPAQALAEVQRLLDEGRPFRAHEVCEAQWKAAPREDADERAFWQGLAQVCVGLTHLARGNQTGARTLLARGADRLRQAGDRHGTDVGRLATQAAAVGDNLGGTVCVVEPRP